MRWTAIAVVLALSTTALAHGGSYRGGPKSGGPGGPPPGPADDPAPVTRWESWWANNKYLHLRIGEGVRETGAATTGSGRAEKGPDGRVKDAREIRAETDDLVRDILVPLFIEGLKDDSFEVRTAAAVALGKSGNADGLVPLERAAAKDTHGDVRDSAILGLGLLGNKAALPGLATVLRDDSAPTRNRSFAAFSIGLIGSEEGVKLLADWMRLPGGGLRHRGDPPLLASVLLALGFTGEADAFPVLRAALDDRGFDDATRAFVLLSIGRAADRGSLPAVVGILEDEAADVTLRRAASVALGRLARPGDSAAVVALVGAMTRGRDPVTRHFAAVSLGTIADDVVRLELRRQFARGPETDRPFLALALGIAQDLEAAPAIRKALASERDMSLRGAYSLALGIMEDPGARELLEAQVKDKGAIWPQGYAALAIGMARLRESAPVLRAALEESNDPRLRSNLAVGLGLLQDPAAKKWFLAVLKSKESLYERGGAAMALGLLRVNEAVPALVAALRDRGEQDLMRAYAMVALGIIADPDDPPKLARFSIDNDYTLTNDPLNEVLSIY